MLAVDAIRALPPPDAVKAAEASAEEVLRLWIIDRRELAATFPPDLYGADVWKWGRLLANVARYAAQAHAARTGEAYDETLEAIRFHFDAEARRGAPAPNGEFKRNEED
ncbi:MAG: DUF5076 domain-containing protein [Alphaproteobacteria bacterium]|nr:DUF5076 domain-containing protein [Alphaproteobacteria bacterium]